MDFLGSPPAPPVVDVGEDSNDVGDAAKDLGDANFAAADSNAVLLLLAVPFFLDCKS